MDRVTRMELMRGVRLTAVRAERFRTGCLSVSLLTPHTKASAPLNAALPYVLRRGTARLPDMESIASALDDLYGVRIEPAVRKKGEAALVGFFADFPDGDFLPGHLDVLTGTAELLGELLLAPATRGGRLRADYVDSERRNLVDDINAEINDKRSYASQRLVELMFRGESYGVSKLGTLADSRRVTAQILTKYYKSLIATAPMELFYCGAEDPERVARVLRGALASLPRSGDCAVPVTTVIPPDPERKPRTAIERMDVTEGRLVMGWRFREPLGEHNYAAMTVFNALFGGAATSRLYLNLRERDALCYYISSGIDRYKSAMFVSAGIDFDAFPDAADRVRSELASLADGGAQEWELEAARRAVVSSIYSSLDDPVGLEGMYLSRALLGFRETPEDLAARCADVTARDVAECAGSAVLTHTYFLTAEGADA